MDFLILIVAVLVAIAIFTWLVQVVKATVQTAFTIAIVVLILQLVFGIGPGDLLLRIQQLWQGIWQSISG
jgi:hypothetical protein